MVRAGLAVRVSPNFALVSYVDPSIFARPEWTGVQWDPVGCKFRKFTKD